jgi:hypothetical protein
VKPSPPAPTKPQLIAANLGQPGKITNACWEKKHAKCGDKVKMIVDVKDFENGTPAQFIIWEQNHDGENDFIQQIDGKVKGNKFGLSWTRWMTA